MFPRKSFVLILAAMTVTAVAGAQELALSQLGREAGMNVIISQQDRWRDPGAQRRGGEAGREAAVRTCMKATFDSTKQSCIQAVNAAGFFDPAAAEACGGMSFDSGITPCLNAIADKAYMREEIELCSGNAFDSGKIECFRSAGRRYAERPRYERRPDLDSFILRQLHQVRGDIESGNILRAVAGLTELISFLEEGSRAQ